MTSINELKLRKGKLAEMILEAIDQGTLSGYRRAHKHSDSPDEFYAVECIRASVTEELLNVVDFEDIEEEDTEPSFRLDIEIDDVRADEKTLKFITQRRS